jgi:hypothetical protein
MRGYTQIKNDMDKLIINILLIGYLLVGVLSIAMTNIWYGVIHLLVLLSSVLLVSYSFCAKCISCQKSCGHPQIGVLRKFVPDRIKSEYQIRDYLGLFPFIIIGVVFPQYWLFQNKVLFTIFWVLNVVVLLGILTRLCTKCENENCKMNRNQNIKRF